MVSAPHSMAQRLVAFLFVVAMWGCADHYIPPEEFDFESQRLMASDGAADDRFGHSVAMSADTAVIGALGAASAYVFVRDGEVWIERAKLTPSDGASGYSVAIDGDTVVIGVPRDSDVGSGSGAVYVFTRTGTTWTEQAKLTASDGEAGDEFGWSVAVSGDVAVIGARRDNDLRFRSGSAYVFVRSGDSWTEQAKLRAGGTGSNAQLGVSVAVSGDTAIIGGDALTRVATGYVFVRDVDEWSQQAKLQMSNPAGNIGEVAVLGDTAVLATSGAVSVFERNGTTWREQWARLESGGSVALFGDTMIISATDSGPPGHPWPIGAAYVFVRRDERWTEQTRLRAEFGNPGDALGSAAAVSGDTVIIGAPGYDHGDSDVGAAYVFQLNPG